MFDCDVGLGESLKGRNVMSVLLLDVRVVRSCCRRNELVCSRGVAKLTRYLLSKVDAVERLNYLDDCAKSAWPNLVVTVVAEPGRRSR